MKDTLTVVAYMVLVFGLIITLGPGFFIILFIGGMLGGEQWATS